MSLTLQGRSIWEARTNLFLYSEEFDNAAWTKTRATISVNAAAAPDGATTADKLVEDSSASATHEVTRTATVVDATRYTLSVFAKAAERSQIRVVAIDAAAFFNLSDGTIGATSAGSVLGTSAIEDIGGGFYRCSLSFTVNSTVATCLVRLADAGNQTYTGDGTSGIYLWGAQLEVGASASPYIKTTTAAATRAADVPTITNLSTIGWNAAEGTIVFEYVGKQGSVAGFVFGFNDGTLDNRVACYQSSFSLFLVVVTGGAAQALINGGPAAAGLTHRAAITWGADHFGVSLNGAAAVTDTSGTVPTVTQLQIARQLTGSYLNSTMKLLQYTPTKTAFADLPALST